MMKLEQQPIVTKSSRLKQMWGWWQDKIALAAQSPWYASYLLRRFYDLMRALRPSKQLVASTVTGAALLVGSIALNPAPAQAATITVNSTADTAPANDGVCTLREAIIAANTNTASGAAAGECAAGTAGSDTINLTGVSGTIALTSNLPIITDHIVLNGPGVANLTINGGGSFKTIQVNNTTLTIDGLTVTRSATHGISSNVGTVNVTNSAISGNIQHGIGCTYGSPPVTASDTTISNNGRSGVFGCGNITLTNATVSGNTQNGVSSGYSNVVMTNTTISGNGGFGAGAPNNITMVNSTISANSGRGASSQSGKIVATNSTVSGNNNVGIYTKYNDITVINSTITGNKLAGVVAGSYYSSAIVTLQNSLIVGNNVTAGTGDVSCESYSASASSNGKNLISNSTGCAALAGEVTAVPVASIISPLANNGGNTQTHALVAGSPAIDAGDNAASPGVTDQRGFARIVNGTIDIGAFESAFAPTATNTPEATATSTPEATATNTPEPTATSTPEATATNTPEATATNTPQPTATNTPGATATKTPKPKPTKPHCHKNERKCHNGHDDHDDEYKDNDDKSSED